MNPHPSNKNNQIPSNNNNNNNRTSNSMVGMVSPLPRPPAIIPYQHVRSSLQSAEYPTDPLGLLYKGNISAACVATNTARVQQQKQDRTKTPQNDEEKAADDKQRKQRATNRLNAWKSQERKRIEFEVLQERQAELEWRNKDLKKENDKIRQIIQDIKAAAKNKRPYRISPPAASRPEYAQNPLLWKQSLNQHSQGSTSTPSIRNRIDRLEAAMFPNTRTSLVPPVTADDITLRNALSSSLLMFPSNRTQLGSITSHSTSATLPWMNSALQSRFGNHLLAPNLLATLARPPTAALNPTVSQLSLLGYPLSISQLLTPNESSVNVPLIRALSNKRRREDDTALDKDSDQGSDGRSKRKVSKTT